MPKNILIFSDGTGQSGGLTPDQRLSNVYKLYRATRVGPDNPIDASAQVAFYDPGLGTASDSANIRLRLARRIRTFASSATGAGIGTNITDCYAAILKHYEPGDRVYIFGFSRGAYTARCIAGVMSLCGVPRLTPDGNPIPRLGSALREIASEAVHKVYEHGSGRDRATYRPQREELARRFRAKYSSDDNGQPNVAPYFIGVFDTVAALGTTGWRRILMNLVVLVGLAIPPLIIALEAWLALGAPFLKVLGICAGVVAAIVGAKVVKARLKVIWHYPSGRSFSWHLSGWRFKFYDTNLDKRVCFARHALAIDETRADFARVPWGQPSEGVTKREPGDPERFEQIWFAGNHSDVGGSYPEDESRLSDIALRWMADQAASLPAPVEIDESKLHTFPSADGMQHCEVESVLDAYPWWVPRSLRKSWETAPRYEASKGIRHPTVAERLALPGVLKCGQYGPYRPEALSKDPQLKSLYP